MGPEDEFVVAGDGNSGVFECNAVANPPHDVMWSFTGAEGNTSLIASTRVNSITITKYSIDSDRDGGSFGELTVHDVVFADHGTYSCLAANFNGDESAHANLTVHG